MIKFKRKVTRAVVPVAGLGTRFLPATKATPKEMLTLVDRPLIDYAISEAREAGIEEFIFVTSRGKSSLGDYFDDAPLLEAALRSGKKWDLLETLQKSNIGGGRIAYVRQERALGLGHAVLCAQKFLPDDEPFAVILPDDVINASEGALKQMIDAYDEIGGCLIAAMEVPDQDVASYGIIDPLESIGRVTLAHKLVEKPTVSEAPSNLAIVGRYILTPSVLKTLERQAPGAGGEIQLTDAIASELSAGRNVAGFKFDGERFDCGSKAGFMEATMALALESNELAPKLLARFSKYYQSHAAE